MKELLRKKSVKISLLFIILLVVMGIVGINVQSAQKNKEYEAHIAAAEKYLSELDYEQAIAEYTLAFEIEPKEEVVDALEKTYLAYAQTCIDGGDYEKAISILEEGYVVTGREGLKEKSEEFQALQEQLEAEQNKAESEELKLQEYMLKLYEMLAEENYFNVTKTMWEAGQSGYTKGVQYEKYIYFPEKNDSLTGTGIGLYRFHNWDGNVDTSYYENLSYYSYYYGDYVDGKREGYGVSVFGFYVFKGEWKNDAPNGWGELRVVVSNWEDWDASIRGNLVDGLWNGTVERQWHNADGTLRGFSFHVANGMPEDKTEEFLAFYEERLGGETSAEEIEEYLAGKYVYSYDVYLNQDERPVGEHAPFNRGDTMGIWEFATTCW